MYLILDLEWNYLNAKKRKKIDFTQKHLKNEIFQIGAILVDENTNYKASFSKFIRLRTTKKVSERIIEETGIKEENILNANLSFTQVISELSIMLEKYIPKSVETEKKKRLTIVTWGESDEWVFTKNMEYYYSKHGKNPLDSFKFKWLNIQKGVNNYLGLDNDLGLAKACEMMDVSILNDRFHNSLDDAYATIGVIRKIGMPILEFFSDFKEVSIAEGLDLSNFKKLKCVILSKTYEYVTERNSLACLCLTIDSCGVERITLLERYINGVYGNKTLTGIKTPRSYFYLVKRIIDNRKDKELIKIRHRLIEKDLIKT